MVLGARRQHVEFVGTSSPARHLAPTRGEFCAATPRPAKPVAGSPGSSRKELRAHTTLMLDAAALISWRTIRVQSSSRSIRTPLAREVEASRGALRGLRMPKVLRVARARRARRCAAGAAPCASARRSSKAACAHPARRSYKESRQRQRSAANEASNTAVTSSPATASRPELMQTINGRNRSARAARLLETANTRRACALRAATARRRRAASRARPRQCCALANWKEGVRD